MDPWTLILFALLCISAILLVSSLVRSVSYLRLLRKLNTLSDKDLRRKIFRRGKK